MTRGVKGRDGEGGEGRPGLLRECTSVFYKYLLWPFFCYTLSSEIGETGIGEPH